MLTILLVIGMEMCCCVLAYYLLLYITMIGVVDVDDNLLEIDPDRNFLNHVVPADGNSNLNSNYFTIDEFNNTISHENLCIFNYNVRSFNRNFDAFNAMLSTLSITPDIIILTETWLADDVNVENYSAYHTFRETRRSGGVSILYLDSLNACSIACVMMLLSLVPSSCQ